MTTKATKPPSKASAAADRVLVGAIGSAQGLQGLVRLKSFTEEPAAIADYAPLEDDAGQPVNIKLTGRETRGSLIARIEGVTDRTGAEALKGTKLYVPRGALPEPGEDEWYQADLVGLAVEDADGAALGTVRAVLDHGAGDVIEIAGADGGSLMVPFTRDVVPVVDVPDGRMVVIPPVETEPVGERKNETSEES